MRSRPASHKRMDINRKQKNDWGQPGWPWELELLSLLFIALAIVLPIYLSELNGDAAAADGIASKLAEQQRILWTTAVAGLYFVHIVAVHGSRDLISTPLLSMLSPLFFSCLAYYRLAVALSNHPGDIASVSASASDLLLLVACVVALTFLLARLRMARLLLGLRDENWDLISPARFDRTYFRLISEWRPLVYQPRRYRVSPNGLLIEGWFYVLAVPFSLVHSVSAPAYAVPPPPGRHFDTSLHNLIRLELTEFPEPLFISPEARDEFLKYCRRLARRNRTDADRVPGGSSAHDPLAPILRDRANVEACGE